MAIWESKTFRSIWQKKRLKNIKELKDENVTERNANKPKFVVTISQSRFPPCKKEEGGHSGEGWGEGWLVETSCTCVVHSN